MNPLIFSSVVIAAAWSGWAGNQAQSGAVIGTVVDPRGSAVAKAKVTVANAGTGARVTSITGSDGSYVIRNLTPNNYEITIEAKDFQKYLLKEIQVDGQNAVRVDVQLEFSESSTSKQEAKLFLEAYERTYEDGGKDRHEENGVHACLPGHAVMDVDLFSDTLFCYHISNDIASEESRIDESTERSGLRACPLGWYVRGIRHTTHSEGKIIITVRHEFSLLCSRRPDVIPSGEGKLDGGCVDNWRAIADLLQYPDRHGPADYWPTTVTTGIVGGKHSADAKDALCATIESIPPGKVLFYHECAGCHGTDGDAPTSTNRMFKKISSRPLGSLEVQAKIKAMSDGDLRKVFAAKHGGETHQIKLSSADLQDLLSYIHTLKR